MERGKARVLHLAAIEARERTVTMIGGQESPLLRKRFFRSQLPVRVTFADWLLLGLNRSKALQTEKGINSLHILGDVTANDNEETIMLTYAANALAEQFEVDSSTMLRALRPVAPDLVKKGNRPTWTIASAAKALEQHRGKSGGGSHGSGGIPAALQALYDQHERREAAMRALPTLDAHGSALIPNIIVKRRFPPTS
jgi:hypothetical protein